MALTSRSSRVRALTSLLQCSLVLLPLTLQSNFFCILTMAWSCSHLIRSDHSSRQALEVPFPYFLLSFHLLWLLFLKGFWFLSCWVFEPYPLSAASALLSPPTVLSHVVDVAHFSQKKNHKPNSKTVLFFTTSFPHFWFFNQSYSTLNKRSFAHFFDQSDWRKSEEDFLVRTYSRI